LDYVIGLNDSTVPELLQPYEYISLGLIPLHCDGLNFASRTPLTDDDFKKKTPLTDDSLKAALSLYCPKLRVVEFTFTFW
jgi:hypothetical protein